MKIDEVLIIRHDDISYAIATNDIEQIQHIPELTPLVLSPDEIIGLSAIGGNIRTVMDTNLILGVDAVDLGSPLSRLLTLTEPYAHMALLVSEVVENIVIDEERIEYLKEPEDAIVAIYRHAESIVQVFDLERLMKGVLLESYALKDVKENIRGSGAYLEREEGASERYLLFKMGAERFAFKIDYLREIINMPHTLTDLAGSNDEIEGMVQLRDELLVIADLRRYYGFTQVSSEKNRILVAHHGGDYIGLIVDEILDIRDFAKTAIDELPENFKDKRLSGVIHSDDRLISLIGENILADLIRSNEKLLVGIGDDEDQQNFEIALEAVVFKIGSEEYAINIEEVSTIIDAIAVTPVPDAPESIDGIINIRGQVVTIASLHKRLGVVFDEDVEHKVIVCEREGVRMGFRVDSVSDVMDIYQDEIMPEEERGDLFTDVLHLDGGDRLVLLFNIEKLFDDKKVVS